MLAFSYETSPVFSLTTFWNTISWKCFMKNDGIRSSLIEHFNPFCEVRLMSTQNTAS